MADLGHPFHQATVYKVETGSRSVRVEEAISLALVFGVTLGELVGVGGVDDDALIELRRAQTELARLERELDRVLHSRNDAQHRLNELTRAQGRKVNDEKFVNLERKYASRRGGHGG
jgi:hypothetical protein